MRVAAVTGASNSGKTTLLAALIQYFVARGDRVGAIKHTHHPLNEHIQGDTARLAAAGGEPVILAGDGEAVIFRGSTAERFRYADPEELLRILGTDIAFIEGFKSLERWPRIELDGRRRISVEEAVAVLDDRWRADVSF
jgi:molybdopterin-guanine dinucleotide biosynthesis protein B